MHNPLKCIAPAVHQVGGQGIAWHIPRQAKGIHIPILDYVLLFAIELLSDVPLACSQQLKNKHMGSSPQKNHTPMTPKPLDGPRKVISIRVSHIYVSHCGHYIVQAIIIKLYIQQNVYAYN